MRYKFRTGWECPKGPTAISQIGLHEFFHSFGLQIYLFFYQHMQWFSRVLVISIKFGPTWITFFTIWSFLNFLLKRNPISGSRPHLQIHIATMARNAFRLLLLTHSCLSSCDFGLRILVWAPWRAEVLHSDTSTEIH